MTSSGGPRVVADTNVFVSGLLAPQGAPAAVLRAFRRRTFTLLMSAQQRAEIKDVLQREAIWRKYHVSREQRDVLLALIDLL